MTRQLGLFNSGMNCRNTAVVGTDFRFSLLSIKWKCLMYSENTVQKIKLNGAPYIHFYVLFWQERDILLYTNVYCIQGHTFDRSYYHIYFSSLWEEQPIQREIYLCECRYIVRYWTLWKDKEGQQTNLKSAHIHVEIVRLKSRSE